MFRVIFRGIHLTSNFNCNKIYYILLRDPQTPVDGL